MRETRRSLIDLIVYQNRPSAWSIHPTGYDFTKYTLKSRLRVVPHFSLGIVERAKREHA